MGVVHQPFRVRQLFLPHGRVLAPFHVGWSPFESGGGPFWGCSLRYHPVFALILYWRTFHETNAELMANKNRNKCGTATFGRERYRGTLLVMTGCPSQTGRFACANSASTWITGSGTISS